MLPNKKVEIEMICIPKAEYTQLLRRDAILDALERNGVDNWDWYGDAIASVEPF